MTHLPSEGSMKMKPSFTIGEDFLPEIKGWKVGSKYTIVLKVEQKSLSKGGVYEPEGKGKLKMEARFEILSAKAAGEGEHKEEPSREDKLERMKEKVSEEES